MTWYIPTAGTGSRAWTCAPRPARRRWAAGATHAWFVGYLQGGAPLAFAVVLEKGGGGLIQAGAVANTVLQKASEIYSQ